MGAELGRTVPTGARRQWGRSPLGLPVAGLVWRCWLCRAGSEAVHGRKLHPQTFCAGTPGVGCRSHLRWEKCISETWPPFAGGSPKRRIPGLIPRLPWHGAPPPLNSVCLPAQSHQYGCLFLNMARGAGCESPKYLLPALFLHWGLMLIIPPLSSVPAGSLVYLTRFARNAARRSPGGYI